ncbi:hypothetical protein TrVE_jg7733 [Triparma verrucosa]|uniref:Uncharacterized protein n=1 Tax=Triparma verrucosa TaxID=1606542 RepID=A0A9W7B7S5_9STRA|nr:hypothetical protein TrVE_jg7733 [Triparma verrucosa]
MSKRTSEDLSNDIEIPDPNSLECGDDEEEVFEEEVFDGSELDFAANVTPATGGDDFMHTDDFRRLFVEFVMVDTLVAMRWLDRKWHKVVEKKLTELEEDEPYSSMIVHGGNDISSDEAWSAARRDRMKRVTKVVFLLNITKVGDCLERVYFLHTHVQELDTRAFSECTSLREMKVPDSLQYFGDDSVFLGCSKLFPSHIYVEYNDDDADVTTEVVAYLRSIQ